MTDTVENAGTVHQVDMVAQDRLQSIIDRIENLDEEKAAIMDQRKDIFLEAKGEGFDTKAIRTIIKLRKKDHAERQEEEAILDLYMSTIGMA